MGDSPPMPGRLPVPRSRGVAHPNRQPARASGDVGGLAPIGHRFHLDHRLIPGRGTLAYRWTCSCSVTPPDTGRPDHGPTPAGPWRPATTAAGVLDDVVADFVTGHLLPLIALALDDRR